MSANNNNPLGEAPLSVNWRMVHTGETFQFTLRDSDESSFVERLNNMIVLLGQEGWQFQSELGGMQSAQAQPVQANGAPLVKQGTPGTSPAPKIEQIDGYVVGGFNKRDGTPGVVVHLYTPYGQYKSYSVYPERANLLPFSFPTAAEWQHPGAPDKASAQKEKVYHAMQFPITVVPDTNDDGSFKLSPKGYQKYRLPKVGELGAPNNGQSNQRQRVVPIPGLVSFEMKLGEMYPEGSLRWVMNPNDEEVMMKLGIPTPLDEWLLELRAGIGMLKDVDTNNAKTHTTQQLWDLLQKWAVMQAGVVSGGNEIEMVLEEGKPAVNVPLAGVVIGMLTDRFALSPQEVPNELVVGLLQRIMKQKAVGVDNPTHNQDFEDNLAELLRITIETFGAGQEMAF
jgi:hypothetical protein